MTVTLVPYGWPCSLNECPPGPFVTVDQDNKAFGFKTEYGATKVAPDSPIECPGNKIRWIVTSDPDVYCLPSGERWCLNVMVQPLVLEMIP